MKRMLCAALCCIVLCVCGCTADNRVQMPPQGDATSVDIAAIDVVIDALDLSKGQHCELYDYCDGMFLLGVYEMLPNGKETEPPHFHRFVFYDTADGTVSDVLSVGREAWISSAIVFSHGVLFSYAPGGGVTPSIRYLSAEVEREVCTVDYAPAGAVPSLVRCGDGALFTYNLADGVSFGVTQVDADLRAVPLLTFDTAETDWASDDIYVSGAQYAYVVGEENRVTFYIGAFDGSKHRFSLREGEKLHSCVPAGNALIVSQEYTEEGKTGFFLVRYDFDGNVIETYPLREPLHKMYVNDTGILCGESYGIVADAPPVSLYDIGDVLTPVALPSDAAEIDMEWKRCFTDGNTFLLTPWIFSGSEENRAWKVTYSA